MRIQGVTGDLPAVAQLMNEGVAPIAQPDPVTAAPAVAAPAAAGDMSGDGSTSDRRQPPRLLHAFDPPLIAQRAMLGLPVGPMIAAHAQEAGITYSAASAAVQREMSHEATA